MKRSERTVAVRDLRCKHRERKRERERNADWAVKKRRDSNKTKPPSLSVSEICVITKRERKRESVCSEVVIVVCVIRWGNRCLRWWEPHAIYFHTCLCRPCTRATDASRHSHITVHRSFFFFPVSMIKIWKIKVVDLVQSTANNTSQVKNRASLAPDMPALCFSTQLSTPILFKSTWRHVNQAELCPIVNF